MTIGLRTVFFAIFGLLILWFLYVERDIFTPFLYAGLFAYLLNPIVDFFSNIIKLPRTLSVIIIYLLIMVGVITGGLFISKRAVDESLQFQRFTRDLTFVASSQVKNLPDWARPTARDTLYSFEKIRISLFSPSLLSLFPKAVSRIISFVIFLFSAFFFLKEGRNIIDKLLRFVPNDYKIEIEILLRRINSVLGGYLRGQLFMVIFMSSVFFIILSFFNVKFALVLAIFSGIAEIVPFIGPIVATTIAAFATFTTNSTAFDFNVLQTTLAVVISYVVVRQVQDYLIAPLIMGKITKLHPLIILFSVLAGGHLMGFLGLIIAVPVAASIRILLEFSVDRINRPRKSQ